MIQHPNLAEGRWKKFSLIEQLANAGGEVERALKWKGKNNEVFSRKAFDRALELFDLTMADPKNKYRLKEIARVREALADFFYGHNEYHSSSQAWRSYFSRFHYAARKHC